MIANGDSGAKKSAIYHGGAERGDSKTKPEKLKERGLTRKPKP
jgi:hypothetical protein